jgi:hydrogenase maturation protease
MMPAPLRQPARVVGLGNVLLGDDGFGPLVIERFRAEYECDPNVEVLDLGTPGLDLVPYLQDAALVVIVDAVNTTGAPGSLHFYAEEDLLTHKDALRLTAHDPGILESLTPLRLSGRGPSELFIIGAVPEACNLGEGFSSPVLTASTDAVAQVANLLTVRGYACHRSKSPAKANLWWLPVEPVAPGGS